MKYLLFVLFCSYVAGCASQRHESAAEIRQTLDQLYQRYLTNEINGAKQDMQKSIEVLLSNTNNPTIDVSPALWLGYARLYVIEDKLGDTNRAAQMFNSARLWYIEEQEHRLKHEDFSVERMKRNVESFTERKCKEDVEEWDKTYSNGAGAAYMKQR